MERHNSNQTSAACATFLQVPQLSPTGYPSKEAGLALPAEPLVPALHTHLDAAEPPCGSAVLKSRERHSLGQTLSPPGL